MSSHMPEFHPYFVNIACPKCAAVGVIGWETNGTERSFVSLSKEFYERISRKKPYPIELVCHRCETVLLEKTTRPDMRVQNLQILNQAS